MKTSRFSAWAAAGLLFATLAFTSCDAKRDMDSGNGPDSSSTTDLPTNSSSDTDMSTDTAATMSTDMSDTTMSR
ncbi:hypothetical protein [Hymenobacter swuensis]|uniref:Secreted protein n=1 Tax=Hymenobacter swuensis DY53 TaxID=1227739 RepID=W8EYR4_9BACT|nr:hypothetical protein [Hymenobacter swuensis]AHJ98259.1 hypothetical protein Hsw_2664 [Hymenobacter swuensis DY53]